MASFRRRINHVLSGLFPEKRLFIQSDSGTRYFKFSPLSQLMTGAAVLTAAGWMALATASVVSDVVATDARGGATVELREAYQTRLDELAAERDTRAAEAHSAQGRFQLAMDQISAQQADLLVAVEEQRELSTALDLMRDRLRNALTQRDDANARLVAEATTVGGSGDDLDETLRAVSDALSDVSGERDTAETERVRLASQVADLRQRAEANARRQSEMMGQIEQALAMSVEPMEKVFAVADIDLDSLLAKVRADYSGEGGPLGAPVVSSRNYDDGTTSRFDTVMIGIDRMNLTRIAAGKVPLATPIRNAFRFTSGFGVRKDPKGRGRRMHAGVDFAAPKGTPIFATGDGIVVAAERESGYGNTVRIRHELGFETVYAHQSKIRVRVGQQVSRGEQIGDMGSTGRSTGVHLHYEVHVNGKAIDPMTFLEAAKDVF